jgi:hypothetical protein
MSLPPSEDEVFDLGELPRLDASGRSPRPAEPRGPLDRRRRALGAGLVLVMVAAAIAWPLLTRHHHSRDLTTPPAKADVLAWLDGAAPSADSSPSRPRATATLRVTNLTADPVVVTGLTSSVPADPGPAAGPVFAPGHATVTLLSTLLTVPAGGTGRTAVSIGASCDGDYSGAALQASVDLPAVGDRPARAIRIDTAAGSSLGARFGDLLAVLCPGRSPTAETIDSGIDGVSVQTRFDAHGVWLGLHNTASSSRRVDFHLTGIGAPITTRVSQGSPWTIRAGGSVTAQVALTGSACGPSTANYTFPISAYLEVSRPGRSEPARLDDLSLPLGAATNALIAASCR